jgi:hypothetical protein
MVVYSISPGVPVTLMDADAGAAPVTGSTFAIAAMSSRTVTWQTIFASAPGSCTVALQGSLDGGTTWNTLDSSTATGGEIRNITLTGVLLIRAVKAAQSGGGALTVIVASGAA